jgi:ABC-type transport system involved in multi-copper enzyme maturation permease subunit
MEKLFWVLLIAALGALIFSSVASTATVPFVFGMIFILLVLIWFRVADVSSKVRNMNVQSTIQKIQQEVAQPTQINIGGGTQQNLTEDRVRTIVAEELGTVKTQLNDVLDRFAKKLIDMENSTGRLRRTLAAAFGSLDDRMRALEEERFPDEPMETEEERI